MIKITWSIFIPQIIGILLLWYGAGGYIALAVVMLELSINNFINQLRKRN